MNYHLLCAGLGAHGFQGDTVHIVLTLWERTPGQGAVSCNTRRLGEAVTSDGRWGQCVDRQDGSLQPLTGGTPEEDPTFDRRASCLYSLI